MTAAWFIGRSQWRRRWVGLIGLGLLAGIVAGVVMASIAGIRRTSSALERLIDEGAIPSVAVEAFSPAIDVDLVAARLREAPGVDHAVRVVGLVGREDVEKNWWFVGAPLTDDGATPVMVAGREPLADAPGEVAISRHTAEKFGLGVGSTFTIGFYSAEQLMQISQDSATEPAGRRLTLTVVGIYLDPRDVERSSSSAAVRGSEAFAAAHQHDTFLGLVLVRTSGEAGTAAVVDAVADLNVELGLSEELGNALQVDDQLRPARDAERESRTVVVVGLAAFAAAAFVAGLVAHGQALRRWMGRSDATQQAIAAMGATRLERRLSLAFAVSPHVVVAAGVAVVTSWLLSQLFPIGVLRDMEPDPGPRLDGLVTAIGVPAVVVVLGAVVAGVSMLAARRIAGDRTQRAEHPVIRVVERASAPLPALVGIRYAVRPGRARVALPVRTAMTAAVVGVSGLVATAIFTSSLTRLESEPARYGVAWDVSLELLTQPNGQQALDELIADPRVADVGVASIAIADVSVDGVTAAASVLTTVKGDPLMVLAEGRAPQNENEVALGPRLLAEIGKSVGDTVTVTDTGGMAATHSVVGSTYSLEYQSTDFNAVATYVSPDVGVAGLDSFALVVARFADGVDREELIAELDARNPFSVMNESYPAPPPEVINLAQLNALPRALALFLAFLAVASLIHALVVTGRARRRDLGVLRAIGFTRRQVGAVLVFTTATIVGVGVALGVPIGLVAGATGWRVVADDIYVGTDSNFPVLTIVVIAAVAVVGGFLAAGLAARVPMRIHPADALRAE